MGYTFDRLHLCARYT